MKKKHTEIDLIGTWQAPDAMTGYKAFIVITFQENHTLDYIFQSTQGSETIQTIWQYERGILTEQNQYGGTSQGSLQWMSDDYFILTILENGSPAYKGAKRLYRRMTGKK